MNIHWSEAKSCDIEVLTEQGEVQDAFGNTNDGWALSVPGAVIEGAPLELRSLLRKALARIEEEMMRGDFT